FADGVKQAEVAAILEPLYRVAEQWEKLVQIYVAQLERIVEPADRLSMLQRIAELCEQKLGVEKGGPEAAFHYWSQALREAPLSELAGDEVERLARELGAWDEAVALYVEIFEAQPEQGG